MRTYLYIALLAILPVALFAQKATVSGYVTDSDTGEKLIGASVYDSQKLQGTATNHYGFFSLTLDTGTVHLAISYVGYANYTETFVLADDKHIDIQLSADREIEEVVVNAQATERIHEQTQMSSATIPIKQIDKLPAFMGEKDVIKSIQLLPGVQSGSEGSSGLYVRGGGPDQNLILLDGVPVYNANHLFGFFSVFNSSAINSAEIIKGGFPARYGGRTSSVLDIRMKEGNSKEFKGEASLGLISSKLTLEAPVVKDKSSFIISARRTYIDVLAQPFIIMSNKMNDNGNIRGGYYFYDLNAKYNHKLTNKSRIYFSTYLGKDKVYMKEKNNYNGYESKTDSWLDWGNITAALRYNYQLSSKMFANFTGTYGRYQFTVGSKSELIGIDRSEEEFEYVSGIYDWAGKVDFDYLPNPNHYIRFGANETFHTFTPGVIAVSSKDDTGGLDTTLGADIVTAHEIGMYIEDDIKITPRLKCNPGLRYSGFSVSGKYYQNIEPRIAFNYLLAENLSVKASYSKMSQYLHLLTNGTVGLPTDLWVPVTDSVPPVTADQFAAGFAYTLNNEYQISLEGYYKDMNKLIEYKEGASFFGNAQNWDKKIEIGEGYSYGAELFVQRKIGKTTGWAGYTLSWSKRHFDALNFGREFPYKYDRRHDISIAILHEFDKKRESAKWKKDLGATWVYGTGKAVSLPVASYQRLDAENMYEYYAGGDLQYYEERNGYREPSYHRMDISYTLSRTKGRTERIWNFSVYNVYNRQNPFMLFVEDRGNGNELYQFSLFPILPSFVYTVKF